MTDRNADAGLSELAYFHEPSWLQSASNRLKTLLLFFDGLAVLTPEYMGDAPLIRDPALAQPLHDRGLLTILRPEQLVDVEVATPLLEIITTFAEAGAFASLNRNEAFAEISGSRLGFGVSREIEHLLLEHGLANPSRDGVSVPVQQDVRTMILGVLPQLLRAPAEALGYSLQPVTPALGRAELLASVLDQPLLPTAGRVVMSDLDQVTFDLSSVPLDDVLDFRDRHGAEHRAYAAELRTFVRSLAAVDDVDRQTAWMDRRQALVDQADDLRRLARGRWKRPMGAFGLGIAGSAVTLAMGNPLGAGIAVASAILGFKRQADPRTAYTYLFSAERRWRYGY